MDAYRRADDRREVGKTVVIGSNGGEEKSMEMYPEVNRIGISITHNLRDSEAVRKLTLLRSGLPETRTEIEDVTDDLVVLHYYPGAALRDR